MKRNLARPSHTIGDRQNGSSISTHPHTIGSRVVINAEILRGTARRFWQMVFASFILSIHKNKISYSPGRASFNFTIVEKYLNDTLGKQKGIKKRRCSLEYQLRTKEKKTKTQQRNKASVSLTYLITIAGH